METLDWLAAGAGAVALFYIAKGVKNLGGLIESAPQVAKMDATNALLSLTNQAGVSDSEVVQNEFAPSEFGQMVGTQNTPSPIDAIQADIDRVLLPSSFYVGLNEAGPGQAILSTQQTSGDWIQGLHLW